MPGGDAVLLVHARGLLTGTACVSCDCRLVLEADQPGLEVLSAYGGTITAKRVWGTKLKSQALGVIRVDTTTAECTKIHCGGQARVELQRGKEVRITCIHHSTVEATARLVSKKNNDESSFIHFTPLAGKRKRARRSEQ